MASSMMKKWYNGLTRIDRRVGMMAFTVIVSLTAAIDQYSKWLAVTRLRGQDDFIIIPGCFNLSYQINTGAAFSFMEGRTDILTIFSAVIALGVLIWACWLKPHERGLRLYLGLILGGAIGNLIDRVRLHYVIDFIHVYLGRHHYPVFNIADSAICVGIFLLVLVNLRAAPSTDAPDSAVSQNQPQTR
jgi:signal peptidase II